MQDAGIARSGRRGPLVLAALGSVLAAAAAPLAGWEAGLCCYLVAVAACLAAVTRAAQPVPSPRRVRR